METVEIHMSCKLIVFDLDGVLVDARELHYEALNMALASVDPSFIITREEHLSTYDGRPTSKKLQMLTESKGLPKSQHQRVWELKQESTLSLIDRMTYDQQKINLLKELKNQGYLVYCASNSIRRTVIRMLMRKGLLEHFDNLLSNQDVALPKPHPAIYWKAMLDAGVLPNETLIVEDSHIGRKAAQLSGAELLAVRNPDDVTSARVQQALARFNENRASVNVPWKGEALNVLIPMAGAGSRFQSAGYTFPKPLINVAGKPMIQRVVENLNIEANYIFLVQKSHYEKYNLEHFLNLLLPGCKIIQTEGVTEGAACTTLLAREHIDNDAPLLIANSDQLVDWNSNEFMYSMVADEVDGGILTFNSTHPKWSFARLDDDGFVAEVAEKRPISDIATVGVYYWRKGSDYVHFADQMIENDQRTNGEFYVCPVYNEAIAAGRRIKVFHADQMWSLGTPEDLNEYLRRRYPNAA
jgi:HAD superfamily hydrolase (TIGR01509 family)